jgi:hypothetical protein
MTKREGTLVPPGTNIAWRIVASLKMEYPDP